MGGEVIPEIERLLRERKILKIKPDRDLILKEIKGAEYDLEQARESLRRGDSKWATVQAYYSMFHCGRALLFSEGYREKSHRALRSALRGLFVTSGRLTEEALGSFEDAISLREQADYGLTSSEASSAELIKDAEKFLRLTKRILKV